MSASRFKAGASSAGLGTQGSCAEDCSREQLFPHGRCRGQQRYDMMPGYYLMLTAAMAAVAIYFLPESDWTRVQ